MVIKLLSDKQIKELIWKSVQGPEANLDQSLIEPFDEKKLGPVSYDLTTIQESQTRGIRRLVTKETLHLPRDIVGFVVPRSRIAKRGLFFSSSLLVDPGYQGKLIFLVYCPEELNRDVPISDLFQIMFFKIGKVEVAYDERESSTAMGREGFGEVKKPDHEKGP